MSIDIDTTSQQYTNLVNGLVILEAEILERAPLFNKMNTAQKRLWLQRDPLLKDTLKFILKYAEHAEKIKEELTDD